MLNLDLDGSNNSYVLMRLFLDAMNKIGKHKTIKSMGYTIVDGLVITDENDVEWTLEVNAKVKIPEELDYKSNSRTSDSNAKYFCEKCNCGIKDKRNNDPEILCSVCEYLEKI